MRAAALLAALALPQVQASVPCDMFQGLHNEAIRRQLADYDAPVFNVPDDNPKHTPRIAISGTVGRVTVGPPELLHPMSASGLHYIDTIYVMDQSGTVIAAGTFGPLSPTGPPVLEFDVPLGTTSVTPYAHCNKHGHFVGSTVAVTETTGQPAVCAPSTCFEVAMANQTCEQLDLLRQDWERREGGTGRRDSEKHRPVAVEDRGRVRITIGLGTIDGNAALIHPQNFGDSSSIHYLEGIYAVDQTGAVIALSYFGPVADPVLEFDIPFTSTTITPYVFCNKHGLHVGDPINVTTASSKVEANCHMAQCLPVPDAGCKTLESVRAWWDRRQLLDHSTRAAFHLPSDKHSPVVTVSKMGDATMAQVLVGTAALYHPMSLEGHHYMESIYLVDQNGKVMSASHIGPSSASPARHDVEVPRGVTQLTPYTYCNKHGLYRGETIYLNRHAIGFPLCGLTSCGEDFAGMDAQGNCVQLEEFKADYIRRHGKGAIHDPEGQKKHTPQVVVEKGRATITVGLGTVTGDESTIHGQYNVEDSLKIHYIEGIYAEDQDGRVIAFALLGPETNPPALEFDIPADVTSVTGYAYCNIHGLFQSDTLAVTGNAQTARGCGLATCMAVSQPEAAWCQPLEALKAAYERRHLFDYGIVAAYYDPSNKHTPLASYSKKDGQLIALVQITDGAGTFHPQSASGTHWIESIYLVDQN
eukprot:Hpha_TRINITY_DN16560_c3_g3::TRINITY_DN16560_c3_g3_i4::g.133730::m.133730